MSVWLMCTENLVDERDLYTNNIYKSTHNAYELYAHTNSTSTTKNPPEQTKQAYLWRDKNQKQTSVT